MTIAIIGGTRHIGPSIVERLVRDGHEVLVLNRGVTPVQLPPGARHVAADRKVPGQMAEALRAHRADVVIDLIGYEASEVEESATAVPSLKHYVFCSSTAVYGRIGRTTPDERTPVAPDSPYTFGKVACENFLMDQHRGQRGLPVTILRLAHPYGPRDHLLSVAGRESLFLDRMRRGRPILIPGDGQARIHPIYVEDVARAFVHVMQRPECIGQTYNLASEQILTLDEYFASIARVLAVPLVAEHIPAEWFESNADLWVGQKRNFAFAAVWPRYESAFNVDSLRATGFQCRTDHDQGVAANVAWLDERGMIPPSSDNDLEDQVIGAWKAE